MNTFEYKNNVKQLIVEMFNIHINMTATNEEITKLTAKNIVLNKQNEQLELEVVGVENLKHTIEHLKNKVICIKKIELACREHIANNELKLKAYKN